MDSGSRVSLVTRTATARLSASRSSAVSTACLRFSVAMQQAPGVRGRLADIDFVVDRSGHSTLGKCVSSPSCGQAFKVALKQRRRIQVSRNERLRLPCVQGCQLSTRRTICDLQARSGTHEETPWPTSPWSTTTRTSSRPSRLALESHGHTVKAYHDGAAGLAALENEPAGPGHPGREDAAHGRHGGAAPPAPDLRPAGDHPDVQGRGDRRDPRLQPRRRRLHPQAVQPAPADRAGEGGAAPRRRRRRGARRPAGDVSGQAPSSAAS